MRKKIIFTSTLSVASVAVAATAIACAPDQNPPAKDTVETTLKKIADALNSLELTIKEKDTDTAVKAKLEAITSDYKNKLVALVTDATKFNQHLGSAEITSWKVTNTSSTSLSLELSLKYTESGVSATNKATIKIVGLGTSTTEIIRQELADAVAKFADRDLKADSADKKLFATQSNINSLETWNSNTTGTAVTVDSSITVSFNKISSDSGNGTATYRVTLSKESQTITKDIKVSGFKPQTLSDDEKAVEKTFNAFTLKEATFDRGSQRIEKTGKFDFDNNRDWLLSMSNSYSRASAYKPTVLDSKKFTTADYFKAETANHLQAKLVERDQIKLEEGVTGKVRIVTSNDIKGEVVVAISFEKGNAKSGEKFLTIKNFLDQKELGTFAGAIYGYLVDKWNKPENKHLKPAFATEAGAQRYIELMQKTFDDTWTYPNDVKLTLTIDNSKGGIDYKNLQIHLLGTYTLNNVVLAKNDITLMNFNDGLSADARLVLEAYNGFTKTEYRTRVPSQEQGEFTGAKWIPSTQGINSIEKLNQKLPSTDQITWLNKEQGVEVEVETAGFNNSNGTVELELIFKKGEIKSDALKITLSGFFTDQHILRGATELYKKAITTKGSDGKNPLEEQMKKYIVYLKPGETTQLSPESTIQIMAYQSYVTNLLNYGDASIGLPGLWQLANSAILVLLDGGVAGPFKYVVQYGGLQSEPFQLTIPQPQFKLPPGSTTR
ncbi:lipoprotein 17-related variable surface protein [Mycoplasmopsis agassizii]|uniref:Lipoprotein-associated type-17 domain-containing protein n=1 Tax=Mycoplasmopsis agassizii TaxID=33922 RepID=A0ABX4H4D7_9BACT|nr:lipoprotein 17-related variable surface protein [Mycoplasmopsis agassizii]PAF54757.1 hypothetical protein CJF60_03400 [Mycoplasmopsis agassizii]SMC19516.1 Lipoprotein associated domain-containing protein [Mycoplasmopsis agassizii]